MDPTQAGAYGIFKWLFDNLFTSRLGFIAGPFLTILVLLRVIGWSKSTAQGETAAIFTEARDTLQGRVPSTRARSRRGTYRRRG